VAAASSAASGMVSCARTTQQNKFLAQLELVAHSSLNFGFDGRQKFYSDKM
jgi:hypothetical protein